MRMTILSDLKPSSSRIFSTLSTKSGRYLGLCDQYRVRLSPKLGAHRSDSAIASPQVGKATQAELDNLKAECDQLSNPHFFNNLSISDLSSSGILANTTC